MSIVSTLVALSLASLTGDTEAPPPATTPAPATTTRSSAAVDVEAAFRTLQDEKAPDRDRSAALDVLRLAAWTVHHEDFRTRFDAVMRRLATDRQADLRRLALEHLAHRGDAFARQLLVDGLEGRRPALVPDALAARLLAGDAHHAARPTLRRLATTADDDKTREEAVLALAGDTASTAMFEALVVDPTRSSPLRQAAALSLVVTDVDRFARLAPPLVLDERQDTDLRASLLTALSHQHIRSRLDVATLQTGLEALRGRTTSLVLRRAINRFLASSRGEPLP